MCGLEQALNEKHQYKIELALKRILLLNSIIISYTGIPLLYSGDEIGQLNDWSYKTHKDIAGDSRWLHRGSMNWEAAKKRFDLSTIEAKIFYGIKKMIDIRKGCKFFRSDIQSIPIDMGNKAVFGFHKEDKMIMLANFSEQEQWVDTYRFNWFGLKEELTDVITERKINLNDNQILLGPYEYLWLM